MFTSNQPSPPPQPSSNDKPAFSDKKFNLKDALSVDALGGKIMPAKVGQGYGFKFEKKFAKGGTASSRADGIAKRGKTKGRMC